MIGIGHVSKDARVDMRVERLDAPIKAFRETGDLGDLGHLDAQLSQAFRGGTGGDHLGTRFDERFGENLDAFLMED